MLASVVADDLELLARWREGDDESGEALIRAHYAAVFGQIRTKVDGDADLASELTQRVFEVLLHKRDEIVENVGAYLRGIARRKIIEHYRTRRDMADGEVSQIPTPGDGASTLLSRKQDVALLAQALRSLPEEDQRLLLWAYADGLTQRTIGERLGLSKQQVNGRIDRVRDKLRTRLEELAESTEQRASVVSGFESWVMSLRRRLET
jgi:RNA polymerase sigma factor (sigma-70 family)